ncbi:MAG: hypothetical protein RRY18_04470 [Clostridia bacterium]
MWTGKSKYGKDVVLLNPTEKGKKASNELHQRIALTNSGAIKLDKEGKSIPLTDTQLSYRNGYLAARRDSADAYNAKHNPEALKASKAKRKSFWDKNKGDK